MSNKDELIDQVLFEPHIIGLTKLEYFSGLAMQALMSGNMRFMHNSFDSPYDPRIAKGSVDLAKALLKELEGSDE